ncbi:MAG: hypothetical protein MZW92_06415 [Comamonadaceae bacterium]|nr:hypothetical protein [Comamonadaceae bacterium]
MFLPAMRADGIEEADHVQIGGCNIEYVCIPDGTDPRPRDDEEGHDGSGLGITMKDLDGEFEDLKEYPILSGICSKKGAWTIDEYMDKLGFKLLHVWAPKIKKVRGGAAGVLFR